MLEKNGYYGIIEFSAEDDCFFGKIVGINDLVIFEGKSVEEIKKSFFDAVDDYIKICKNADKDPEKTYKGSFNVRIAPELHKKAVILATAEHMSLNQFIETAIAQKVQMIGR